MKTLEEIKNALKKEYKKFTEEYPIKAVTGSEPVLFVDEHYKNLEDVYRTIKTNDKRVCFEMWHGDKGSGYSLGSCGHRITEWELLGFCSIDLTEENHLIKPLKIKSKHDKLTWKRR